MSDRRRKQTGAAIYKMYETISDFSKEIDRLRANQIPGRCGECVHSYRHVGGPFCCSLWSDDGFDPEIRKDDFCHEFKPK